VAYAGLKGKSTWILDVYDSVNILWLQTATCHMLVNWLKYRKLMCKVHGFF